MVLRLVEGPLAVLLGERVLVVTGLINAIPVCPLFLYVSFSLPLSLSLSLCSHAHTLLRINDQCEVGTCTYTYLYIYNMRLVEPSLPPALPHHTYMSRSISVLHSLAVLVNDPQQILLFPPAQGLCPVQVCTHQQIVVYTSINTLELVRMSIRQHNCMYQSSVLSLS